MAALWPGKQRRKGLPVANLTTGRRLQTHGGATLAMTGEVIETSRKREREGVRVVFPGSFVRVCLLVQFV